MSTMGKDAKRTISVTINDALYQRARQHGINLSQRLSEAGAKDLQQIERDTWKQANKEGLHELNRISDACGHFTDEHRKF